VLAEEDVDAGDEQSVRVIQPHETAQPPVLRADVRTAAVAAVGGVLAGAATVAAVKAVAVGTRRGSNRRLVRRRDRPANVVASRSFLVDVHVLGR
jgi:hypothetical protein